MPDQNIWQAQKKTLDDILKAVGLTVSGFYRPNGEIPTKKVLDLISKNYNHLIAYSSKEESRPPHLRCEEQQVGINSQKISKSLEDAGIDLIVPIASSGFEPAMLIADYLGVENILPVRYSSMRRKDMEVLVHKNPQPEYLEDQIRGKKVLIVDDTVFWGRASKAVTYWLMNLGLKEAYFTAIRDTVCALENEIIQNAIKFVTRAYEFRGINDMGRATVSKMPYLFECKDLRKKSEGIIDRDIK